MAGHGATVLMGVLAVGCREVKAPSQGPPTVSVGEVPSCASDSLRPATAAPAEGLWIYQGSALDGRVAAMIGPARIADGGVRLTRAVETVETRPGAAPIRQRLDSAAMRLELLPSYRYLLAPQDGATVFADEGSQPAAVYPLGPMVLLASYEPCGVHTGAPRIRYLRRDHDGGLVVDVMLHRESGGS